MDSILKFAIICQHTVPSALETKLASNLNLALVDRSCLDKNKFDFVLYYVDQVLCLEKIGDESLGPLSVNLLNSALAYRKQQNLSKELLVKAIGIRGEHKPLVWDLTAGLGQDSMILLGIGCKVRMCERNNIVHALLNDGVRRAKQAENLDKGLLEQLTELNLIQGDSLEAIAKANENLPDVIYIDPMFPEKKKNAKAKKAMQYCQQIVGQDLDSESLLKASLSCAKYRVVVKRPKSAPMLGSNQPSSQIVGKTVRYDIYSLKSTARYLEEKKPITR